MSYGYNIEREKPDPLLTVIDTAANEFYIATAPGAWLVDTFPFCKSFSLYSTTFAFLKEVLKYGIFLRGCLVHDSRKSVHTTDIQTLNKPIGLWNG
jgi:hypothetical protein